MELNNTQGKCLILDLKAKQNIFQEKINLNIDFRQYEDKINQAAK